MKIPIAYSYRNLWTRRLTTALTMGGVALVVFAFSAVLMLAYGLQKTLVGTGSDDNAFLLRKSAQTEIISAISRESASIVKTFPEVAPLPDGKPFASPELCVIINLLKTGSNDMGNVIVRGTSEIGAKLRGQVKIVEGRMFGAGTSEVVVGSSINGRFQGCRLGDKLRFGQRFWTIVGIFDAGGSGFDSEIWGDSEQMLPAFGRPVYSVMLLRLKNPSDFDALKARLSADPRLSELEVKREKEFYAEQSVMMSTFISVLGVVITVIFSFGAVVGAMITMYAAVANRTIEIGTLRALGFRRRSILTAFLIEALFISLIGGGAGLALASLLQFFTISTTNWGSFAEIAFGFRLNPAIVLLSLIFTLVMGVAGGFLPAVRASRMNIVNALRAG